MQLRVNTIKTSTKNYLLSGLLLCVLAASFGFINPQAASAATGIPKLLNFQGKLTIATAGATQGNNVADGTYAMQFKLYDALTSGTLLWTETYDQAPVNVCQKVQVTNGVFNVKLGSCNALTGVDFTSDSLYLSVNFAPTGTSYDGEMSPRKQLTASAYAFNANNLAGNGKVDLTNTSGPQVSIAYDSSNKWTSSTSSAGVTTFTFTGTNPGSVFTQSVATTGSPTAFTINGGAHTTLSNAEASDVNFNLARTVQFGQNTTLALQRAVVIQAPTYASSAATKTITDAAAMAISGAPVKGTNVAITNAHGLLIQAGAVSTATNSYGLTVNAQTGATNNYAAVFQGGNVGIGTTAPTSPLHVAATFTGSSGTETGTAIVPTFNQTSSASAVGLAIQPTINQTSTPTGGYKALQINVTETALGSGTKLLIDAGTGGGSYTSKFSVANTGAITAAALASGGGSKCLHSDVNGLITTAAADCGTGGTSLDAITNAVADNTPQDSTNKQITWNWSTLTSENALTLGATGTGLTSGSALRVTTASTGAISNGAVQISGSGAYTGTGGLLNVSASASTAGTLASFTNNTASYTGNLIVESATGLTTGKLYSVTLGSTLTTGGYLGLTSASYNHGNATETGNLISLAFTDATNGTATSTTNGINIQPTINATSGAATRTINGLNVSPTFTACSAGTCAVNGINIGNVTDGTGFTGTGLSVGTGWDVGFNIQSAGNVITEPAVDASSLTPAAALTVTGAAHGNTNGIANAEATDFNLNLARTVKFVGGASTSIALQRAVTISAPTYRAVTNGLTITDMATLALTGAPIRSTFATVTNTHGLYIGSNAVGLANYSYGLTVNAQTGATQNNVAAQFLGGGVSIDFPKMGSGIKFQASTSAYSTGTALANGSACTATNIGSHYLITGSGTSWTDDMVYGTIVFANNIQLNITAYVDSTHLCTNTSTTVSSSAYTIYKAGALIGTDGNTTLGSFYNAANNSRLFVGNGTSGANIDVRGVNAAFKDQSVIELEGSDYDVNNNSVRLQYYGQANSGGTTMGYSNVDLGALMWQGVNTQTALIGTTNNIDLHFGTNNTEKMVLDKTGKLGIGTTAPSTKLQVAGTATDTTGTLASVNYPVAVTQGAGAITGASIDLNTNVTTPAAGQNITALNLLLPTASTTSNTTTYTGVNLGTAGAITNGTAGSAAWRGANIVLPNITQSAGGSVTSSGILLTTGSVTTAGTQHGLNIAASGVGAGTLNGINISGITAGAGTENAITVGSGWDKQINGNGWSVDGSGNLTVASCTGCGGSTTLDAIQNAAAPATRTHGTNSIVWNWALGSSGNTAFTFGENTAASSGGQILAVSTLASSTAKPFSVSARGNIIIDTTANGGVTIGNATAAQAITIDAGTAQINIGNSANGKTIAIGSTAADTIQIGTQATNAKTIQIGNGAVANTITIGSASATNVSITDDNWNVSTAGAANFVSIGATTAGTGAFTTLSSTSTSNIGSGSGVVTINSSGALNLTGASASTFAFPANTANALQITNGSNSFFALNTTLNASGATGVTVAPGAGPSFTGAAGSQYAAAQFSPGTYTINGATQVTSTGTSGLAGVLFNQLTVAASTTRTVNESSNVIINGGVRASSSTGTGTITNSYALNILAGSALNATNGAVTNGYGLSVNAPTGATNNYAAALLGGNVGIGTASPTAATLVIQGAGNTNATHSLRVTDSGGTNPLFVVRDDGFMGVGATAGQQDVASGGLVSFVKNWAGFTKLELVNSNSSGGTNIRYYYGSTVGAGTLYDNSLNKFIIRAQYQGDSNTGALLTFETTPIGGGTTAVERMRIDGVGNVGIGTGTTTIGSRLQVSGTATDTTGTLMAVNYPVAVTQGAGAVLGATIDLNTNVTTPGAGQNITALNLLMPTASTTSNSTVYSGINLGTAGAVTNGTAGSFAWRGAAITTPNITQSSGGSVTASGVLVTTGSITTAGVQHGLNVAATGVGAGTLNGINISAITGSGGTENAITIGSGWDKQINGTGWSVDGSGALTVASCTGCGGGAALSSISAAVSSPAAIDSQNFGQTWNWSTLTTQRAFTFDSTATGLTTGGILGLGSSTTAYNHTASETGSVATITFKDTTSNAFTTTTNGLLISPTINAASAAATRTINGANIAAPTLTACAAGTCTYTGLQVSTQVNNGTDAARFVQNGIQITPNATGSTTTALTGLNIGGITTPGTGTETAINVGAGWDSVLTVTGNPASSTTAAQIQLGGALSAGSASGTYIGINPSSFSGDFINLQNNGTQVLGVSATGNTIHKTSTNSTTAFQFQNSGGNNIFSIDSTGSNQNNLLTNTSIESSANIGNAGDWQKRGGTETVFSQDSTQVFNGKNSLKITTTATAGDGAKQNVTLTNGTTYTLSFYAKLDSASAAFSTMQAGYSFNGTDITTVVSPNYTVLSNGWTRFSYTFLQNQTNAGTPYIFIKQTDAAVHTFYIDAVTLQTDANADANYREGKIQIGGIISNALILQNAANSTTAFQVLNSSGTPVLTIDTTDSNLVANPGAETNTVGWAAKGAAAAPIRDTSQQKFGLASFKTVTTAASGDGAQYTLTSTLAPGTYAIEVSVKNSGTAFGTDKLVAGIVNGAGDNDCTLSPQIGATVPSNSGWTRLTCTVTISTTNGTAFYLKQTEAVAHTFWFDAIELDAGSVLTPYGAGGLSFNGIIKTPLTLQNQSDSNSALQLFNASGTNKFLAVDTLNGTIATTSNIASGTLLSVTNNTTNYTGTLLSVTANGTSTGVSVTGQSITTSADTNINTATKIGLSVVTGAITQATAATGAYSGLSLAAPGAISTTTAAGTLNWRGLNITSPAATANFAGSTVNNDAARLTVGNLTQTAGTLNSSGLTIDSGSTTITTGGTLNDINIIVGAIAVGTHNGLNISTNGTGRTFTAGSTITGINLDYNTNVTATGTAMTGLKVQTAADTNIAAVTKTGINITTGAITETAASTGTYAGVSLTSPGAISTTTAAGTLNWRGLDITTAAATANFAGSTIVEDGLRVTTGNITQTAGTMTQNGIIVAGGATTITTGGTLNALKVVTGAIAVGTYNGLLMSTDGSARTFTAGSTITGINLDFNTNVTANGTALTGIKVQTPADTNIAAVTKTGINIITGAITETAASTGTYAGLSLTGPGAISTTTAAGTLNWRGLDITTPSATANFAGSTIVEDGLRITPGNITQTAGTMTQNGVIVAGGSTTITTGGTLNALKVVTGAIAVGTYNGLLMSTDGSARTFTAGSTITGFNLDFSTNVTATGTAMTGIKVQTAADTAIAAVTKTGINITTGAVTETAASTGTYAGLSLTSPGAAGTTTAAGTLNWRGLDITTAAATANFAGSTINEDGLKIVTGNLTQTAGTANSTGINITLGTITTGGSSTGLKIVGTGTAPTAGTFERLIDAQDNNGNSLFEVRDLSNANNTFGAAATAGAFIDRNSYWGEEFNIYQLNNCTQATTTNNNLARGSDGYVNAGTTSGCNNAGSGQLGVSNVLGFAGGANTCVESSGTSLNGLESISASSSTVDGTDTASCLEYIGGSAAGTASKYFAANNLPVVTMKVTPSTYAANANALMIMGLGASGATTLATMGMPTDGIYFSNCTTYSRTAPTCPASSPVWNGFVVSGSTLVGSVQACTAGAETGNIVAGKFTYMRIEVRANNDIHFFVDTDVSNGIKETECGTGVSGTGPGATALTAWMQATYNGSANTSVAIAVDYFRVWQDDNVTPEGQEAPLTSTAPLAVEQSTAPAVDNNVLLAQFMSMNEDDVAKAETRRLDVGRLSASVDIVTPKITSSGLSIDNITALKDAITFKSDTIFFGRPYFNTDSAGFALVKTGDKQVDITFDSPYVEQPIVNATISIDQDDKLTPDQQQALADQIFGNNVSYLITKKSEKGFTILLNKPTTQDIKFSWSAFAVKGAKTFTLLNSPGSSGVVNVGPAPNTQPSTPDSGTPSNTAGDNNSTTPETSTPPADSTPPTNTPPPSNENPPSNTP